MKSKAAALTLEWQPGCRPPICKGARTLVGSPEGRLYMNLTGNSGMATAGSGDVLTGILAGLSAQGMHAFDAACAGVYLHGMAGDRAAHKKSEYGVTAGDLTLELEALFPELLKKTP
ncbi:MAG: NAD(P)H-hydrate dehydratase [Eisenbergiella massiliensis]